VKFKLDENPGSRTANVIADAGHDVQTVSDEKLNGAEDVRLYNVCALEGCCLITLDVDFADVLRFPPGTGAGIAVLRPPGSVSLSLLSHLVTSLLAAIDKEPINGRLWIVEPTRIRIHDGPGE
jgi:predicted nuclease of predicted toxin-antitoxin system